MRKSLLLAALVPALIAAGATSAATQPKPLASATIVVPSSPGGGFDQTARAVQEAMQSNGIVRSVTVDNRPGGGGMIGLKAVLDRAGDPGTMLMGGLALVSAALTSQAPISLDDATPLARLTAEWQAFAVSANSDIATVDDLVARMKADPGGVAWGGGAAGSLDHVTVGLFAAAIGVDPTKINYVPFSGGGQVAANVMGGQVPVGVSGISEFENQAASGDLRILAVLAPEPVEGVDAPTLEGAGIDLEVGNWRGMFGAPDLAADALASAVGALDQAVATQTWKDTLAQKRWSDAYLSGEAFDAFVAEERARTTDTLRKIGLLK